MKAIQVFFLAIVVFIFPFVLNAQTSSSETSSADSTVVNKESYYKTAEIAYQIESTMRYVKNKNRQIDAYQNEHKLIKNMVDNLEGYPASIKFLHQQWNQKYPVLDQLTPSAPDKIRC